MVKARIVCTIGPASSSRAVLKRMMFAGMSICRFNFSHNERENLVSKVNLIKNLNKKHRKNLKILGDLQGHRIRIGSLKYPLQLKRGEIFYLSGKSRRGGVKTIPFDYQNSLKVIKEGYHLFIDDGNIDLEVIGHSRSSLKVRVITGGLLKQHKGVNIPQAKLNFGSINSKDIKDINFCKKEGIEYIAQSFVCSRRDITEVREVLGKKSEVKIFAKIESRQGVKNIDQIIKAADGIVIARGDMGVSLPIYQIPIVQKMIIKKCNQAKKPVITATQMLESMSENLRPTRAEVTDVANAILDGSDMVMLSAETATGKYPVETVKMMNNIVKFAEKSKT